MADDYYDRRLDEPSNSSLKVLRNSPYDYYDYVTTGRDKRTPAKTLGRVIHMALLEPERFRRELVAIPDLPLRSKGDREAMVGAIAEAADLVVTADLGLPAAEFRAAIADELQRADRTLVTTKDLETVRGQIESLKLPIHTLARKLIACGEHEKVIRWTDSATGITCKGRLDIYEQGNAILADAKSCEDASADAFRRSLWTWGHHFQDAMYQRGLKANGLPVEHSFFVLVEKAPPYHWNVLRIDRDDVAAAHERISRDLELLRTCLDTNTWPGLIGSEPATVSLYRKGTNHE